MINVNNVYLPVKLVIITHSVYHVKTLALPELEIYVFVLKLILMMEPMTNAKIVLVFVNSAKIILNVLNVILDS